MIAFYFCIQGKIRKQNKTKSKHATYELLKPDVFDQILELVYGNDISLNGRGIIKLLHTVSLRVGRSLISKYDISEDLTYL